MYVNVIHALPAAALIIGLLVGLIFWLAGAQDTFGPKIVFKVTILADLKRLPAVVQSA
jgi:hypothetical protein